MAFSIFNKKSEPPPKPQAKVPPPAKPRAVSAPVEQTHTTAPSRGQSQEQLSQKINQIEAEMDEFTLDFTSPSASRPARSGNPAPQGALAPTVAAPMPPPAPTAPSAFEAMFPSLGAPPASAAPPPPPVQRTPAPAVAAPRAKPLIEHGFNPSARSSPSAKSVRPIANVSPLAPLRAFAPETAPGAGVGLPSGATAKSAFPQGVASVMMMEVEQRPFEAAPVLEEAAILYANGQALTALAALSDALQNAKMPDATARQGWFLLFDLYENLGRRDEFETAALDFAVRFETSPPAYNDRSSVKDPALVTGSAQYFALTGTLDGAVEKQFAQLAKTAERNQTVRIEFGKIEAVAAEGCALLLAQLKGFKKSGHGLVFSSAEHLIKLLNGAIETGRRSDPEVFWMLLLELYQFQQMQAAFEETALNYCITYEVSPPSWVELAKSASSTPPANGPATLDVPQDAFYLKGELAGASELLLNDIAAHAGGKSRVVIDMFGVKRIDFIAAGGFLNVVQTLRGMSKEIEIRSSSPLVAALLVSMGFLNHVRLTQRGK